MSELSLALSLIRNFSIIAHIDHGKSTLADRLLELTGTVKTRDMKSQLLDKMDLEREKGITIKLAPVRMNWQQDGNNYQLNLIDTPGHVDFSYEVSRSLQACEGAILVVDATQGIQAQTLANLYLAIEQDLVIIPVLNKIDLPAADVAKVSAEIIDLLGCKEDDILQISAKTGLNVESVLNAIIARIPGPKLMKTDEMDTRALIFDSYYDDYRGVVLYVRLFGGEIKGHQEIKMMATGNNGVALEVGHLSPQMQKDAALLAGEIGYIVTNLHSTSEAKVGDTVTLNLSPASSPLVGYKDVTPFVYAGFFPSSNEDYENLKEAIEKLSLSDSALKFTAENSPVLGFGFRIGFLGLLHLDIVKERLEREYNLEIIVTNPSTDYMIKLIGGEEVQIKSASELPDPAQILAIKEPWIKGEIVSPKAYLGGILSLIANLRGTQKSLSYTESGLAIIDFEAPLANMLTDFYDSLKSITSGYGSFNYQLDDYRQENLVRLDFYVAGEMVDALSLVVHRAEAPAMGRKIVEKLKQLIPKQLFKVSLQAAINGKFIAREDVSALKKNVTAHLYGGDVSRKKKLWAKQKAGKARMKKFGKVEIPNEAFTVLIKKD